MGTVYGDPLILSSWAAISSTQRAALIALYNSTNGDSWTDNTNWKGISNEADGFSQIGTEGTWFGITVSAAQVVRIGLNANNLVGTLPAELGNITSLRGLLLAVNQLSGTIPTSLGNLSNLSELWIFDTQLTGSIPTELGSL